MVTGRTNDSLCEIKRRHRAMSRCVRAAIVNIIKRHRRFKSECELIIYDYLWLAADRHSNETALATITLDRWLIADGG